LTLVTLIVVVEPVVTALAGPHKDIGITGPCMWMWFIWSSDAKSALQTTQVIKPLMLFIDWNLRVRIYSYIAIAAMSGRKDSYPYFNQSRRISASRA
jgi:hypothetical protein